MKKLILSLFAVAAISMVGQAQLDLTNLGIINPQPGSTQDTAVDSIWTIGVQNSGTTTLNAGDTVIFAFRSFTGTTYDGTLLWVLTSAFAPTDAVGVTSGPSTLPWTTFAPHITPGGPDTVCVDVIPWMGGAPAMESDITNNSACNLYQFGVSSSILETAITIREIMHYGDNLYLSFTDGISKHSSIEVFNISGQLVKTIPVNGSDTKVVSVKDLTTGVYIVRLMDDGKPRATQKIMVGR